MPPSESLGSGVDPCFAALLTDPRSQLHLPRPGSAMDSYRDALNQSMISGDAVPVAAVEEHDAPSAAGPIKLRLYRPVAAAAPQPAILFVHGGGFIIGSLDSHDEMCRELALRSGAVVVAVSGVGPGTLTQAFNMTLPAGGSAVADFELNPPVTTAKTAVVKVDPDNAIKETNKDNNSATFSIAAPTVEQPKIAIQAPSLTGSAVGVTIVNNGGPISDALVTVRIKLGGAETSDSKTLSLSKGQSATFSVTRPQGNGTATIDVVVGGQVLASTTVQLTP